MLSGVSPMQTGGCARNHRKPGSLQPVSLPAPPHALKFGREEVMVPSLRVQARQSTHPHSAKPPSGQDVKAAEPSEGTGERGMEGPHCGRARFCCIITARECRGRRRRTASQTQTDAFYPAAPYPPVCRSQYGRRHTGLLPLKLRWQARLSGAARRGQEGAGGAPTPRILPPATTQGSKGQTCHAPLSGHRRAVRGCGRSSAGHRLCVGHNCLKASSRQSPNPELWFAEVGVGWEGGLRRSLRPFPTPRLWESPGGGGGAANPLGGFFVSPRAPQEGPCACCTLAGVVTRECLLGLGGGAPQADN